MKVGEYVQFYNPASVAPHYYMYVVFLAVLEQRNIRILQHRQSEFLHLKPPNP